MINKLQLNKMKRFLNGYVWYYNNSHWVYLSEYNARTILNVPQERREKLALAHSVYLDYLPANIAHAFQILLKQFIEDIHITGYLTDGKHRVYNIIDAYNRNLFSKKAKVEIYLEIYAPQEYLHSILYSTIGSAVHGVGFQFSLISMRSNKACIVLK